MRCPVAEPCDGHIIAANLAVYAKRARVSIQTVFAYVLALHVTAQLADLYYHDIGGCPLDFTEDHEEIVKGLKKGRFCSDREKKLKKNSSTPCLDALNTMLDFGRQSPILAHSLINAIGVSM